MRTEGYCLYLIMFSTDCSFTLISAERIRNEEHYIARLLVRLTEETEGVQSSFQVTLNLVQKRVRFPCLSPERYGDRLTKMVQLQTAAADSGEYGSIVDHLFILYTPHNQFVKIFQNTF